MRIHVLPLLAIALLSPIPAGAEERKTVPTTPLTLDENGLPIVSVTLHSLRTWNATRTFRFLLDTGSGACAVDSTVPSEFFWDEPDIDTTLVDSANQSMGARSVILKRVEVGKVMRDGIMAVRMDLRAQVGRFQDEPLDGILGMSFLRGTRFLLDPKAGRLVWWENHVSSDGRLPITEGPDGPLIRLRFGGQETSVLVDTGASGGIQLPNSLLPKGEGRAVASVGLSGVEQAGSEVMVDRIGAGSSAWTNLPVEFQGTGATGGIGARVWLAAPVCFDFITNHVSFTLDAAGNLPIRRERNRNLPIVWDRKGGTQRLVVLKVKPGSAMEKAGCQIGDELIQVGDLQGANLTRRAVQDRVATGARHVWVVRRNGQDVKLQFGPS
ncbi:aspartyl protease family protein [Mesoterricola silvestris]|uniref:PDZ domain-containing protein n=1 Tax=Mesoterricola silvestris TaxID=2927979 RepID=A0AA48KDK2_9BACT|nr:aspartyl protease family protein [Mesoterricola silvestris]BDU74528.1 hypothetical protein METEAL_37020 [Mesoterricola silvestris]